MTTDGAPDAGEPGGESMAVAEASDVAAPPRAGRLRAWTCRHPVLAFVALTYAVSFGGRFLWGEARQGTIPRDWASAFYWLVAFGPAIGSLVVTAATEGAEGVRALLRTLLAWRVPVRWWLFAIFLYPLSSLATLALAWLQGATAVDAWSLPEWDGVALAKSAVFWSVTLAAEEIGWRGLALRRLLPTKGPLVASVYVALVWTPWHLAGFQFGSSSTEWRLAVFAVATFPMLLHSLVSTWIYVGARGSLLLTTTLHVSFDVSQLRLRPLLRAAGPQATAAWDLLYVAFLSVLIWRNGWLRREPRPRIELEPSREPEQPS